MRQQKGKSGSQVRGGREGDGVEGAGMRFCLPLKNRADTEIDSTPVCVPGCQGSKSESISVSEEPPGGLSAPLSKPSLSAQPAEMLLK